MFPAPRRRGATRFAAGSVLAATALASGGFAALGATAAHADGTPGSYANPAATSWATDGSADPTFTAINVPDTISSLASVSLTLHNFTDDDVSGLNLDLFDPSGNLTVLEYHPSSMAGGSAVDGQDITFSSDGTGEPGNGDSLDTELGQPGTGEWDLAISDDNAHLVGSIDSWTLDLTSAPSIAAQPDDVSALSGDNAEFTAAADGIPTPTVQWQSSTDGGDTWTPIDGANTSAYDINGVTTALDGNSYRAVFTSPAGTATSQPALLSVQGNPPTVTQQPADATVVSGGTATFTATATGDPAVSSMQWQKSTDGGQSWTPIEGANAPTYSINGVTTALNGNYYRAAFTSAAGVTQSDAALLNVQGKVPAVTQQPQDASVVAGTTPTFTAVATGDPAISFIHWEKSTDNGASYQPIPGANAASYGLDSAATVADSGSLFRAVFSNDIGDTTTSPAKLTVSGEVPSAPRSVWVSQTGPGAITIHWAPSVNGGTPAMTAYSVGYSAGQMGNGEGVAASATSDTFKGLAPGHYVASVAAVNAAGSSTRVSVPVTVVAPTTTPVAGVSVKHVIAGGKFVLSGTGPKSSTLTIQRQLPGKAFVKLTTVKSNSWGAYSIAIPAANTAAYRVVSTAGKVSNKVTVAAAYAVHVQTVRTAARAYNISGWITPVAAGRTVHVTATVAGKLVKIATLTTSPKGKFSTHYKFAKKGPVTLHVTVSSSALNTAGSLSKALTVS